MLKAKNFFPVLACGLHALQICHADEIYDKNQQLAKNCIESNGLKNKNYVRDSFNYYLWNVTCLQTSTHEINMKLLANKLSREFPAYDPYEINIDYVHDKIKEIANSMRYYNKTIADVIFIKGKKHSKPSYMWPELFEDVDSVGSGHNRCNEINSAITEAELNSEPQNCIICVIMVNSDRFCQKGYVYTVI
jgi:hypothetical protein